ncbi:hypothetical protein EI555_005763 [Monodon monoceros]|uniref:Uncharacterized protein n=1 Tax=Monodon monoceros TaxID=40151 RepID=A0A4U1EUH0_MONMO|nr:hypothetical protein EI555_005763 [Monodon monoceros]
MQKDNDRGTWEVAGPSPDLPTNPRLLPTLRHLCLSVPGERGKQASLPRALHPPRQREQLPGRLLEAGQLAIHSHRRPPSPRPPAQDSLAVAALWPHAECRPLPRTAHDILLSPHA